MNTDILVYSRSGIEAIKYAESSVAVISIHDPELDKVHLNFTYNDVLYLSFHDVERDYTGKYYPISKSDAIKIAEFTKKYYSKVRYIIVNCEAGISRSSGIAGAILKFFTNDDSQIFENKRYYPNMNCYFMVLSALEEVKNETNQEKE